MSDLERPTVGDLTAAIQAINDAFRDTARAMADFVNRPDRPIFTSPEEAVTDTDTTVTHEAYRQAASKQLGDPRALLVEALARVLRADAAVLDAEEEFDDTDIAVYRLGSAFVLRSIAETALNLPTELFVARDLLPDSQD